MPKKFNCKNCGQCCGPVPINREERNKIRVYLLKHPEIAEAAKSKAFSTTCVFRDEENGKCMIYQCRPYMCTIYRCDTDAWFKDIKIPRVARKGVEIINEVFGNPDYRLLYKALLDEAVPESQFIRKDC